VSGPRDRLETKSQADAYSSPWSMRTRLKGVLWSLVWCTLFRPTPKPLSPWRVLLLRAFGTKVTGRPFVASSARVRMPWNLTLEDRACIAPDAEIYNLGPCILRARSTVTQRVYLCGGTHDLTLPSLPLVTGTIEIGEDAFVGAQALILPGVHVGAGAVVGAGSVVTKDVPAWTIVAGNPAKEIGIRQRFGDAQMRDANSAT
jgi:putative colanic acid biosynthesis acetyltransferase WcaF